MKNLETLATKNDLRNEIKDAEERLRNEIKSNAKDLRNEIKNTEERLKSYVGVRFDALNKRISSRLFQQRSSL